MNIINKETFEKSISNSIKENCSDIFISSENLFSVRILGKIHKQLFFQELTEEDTKSIFEITLSYLGEKSKKHILKNLKKKYHAGYAISVLDYRFRVNVSVYKEGYFIVFRHINSIPPAIEDLRLNKHTEMALKYISEKKSGIFFVVGPTGSGKTTSLSSIINYINKNFEKNIITLEDPVEYKYKSDKCNIVQKELGRDFKEFKEALKSAMRESPDIILIGEIRDKESLELALEAAETGHLVFATLHTNSAIATIQRVLSLSENEILTRDRLRNSFLGSLAQTLAPISKKGDDGNIINSRLLIWEILVASKQISTLIKDKNEIQINGTIDNSPHSQSFNKTLEEYYKNNIIDLETALKYSPDKTSLSVMLNSSN